MYLCIYVSMYLCMYVCMYVSMYLCIYVSMYVCMYVSMYLCIYVSMYVCMYVCMSENGDGPELAPLQELVLDFEARPHLLGCNALGVLWKMRAWDLPGPQKYVEE